MSLKTSFSGAQQDSPVPSYNFVGLPAEQVPQLLHVWCEDADVYAVEMPLTCASLTSKDCFMLDAGDRVYTWSGQLSSEFEMKASTSLARERKRERGVEKCQVTCEMDSRFWGLLGGPSSITSEALPRLVGKSVPRLRGHQSICGEDAQRRVSLYSARSFESCQESEYYDSSVEDEETPRAGITAVPGFDAHVRTENSSDEAPSVRVFRPSGADVKDDPFQIFEFSPVHVPQLLHVWRREREAFAVEMPLTCASLREEECFVLDAGKCVYIWCGRRSSPSDDTACTSLAQCRVEERRVDQCQATREIDDQFWDLLGGSTPIQSGALPRVVPSGFLTARSVQDTFRSVDPATEVTAPGCKRTVTFEEANSKRDLARTSTDHEAGKTDLKETTKLGQRADSVADEDFPPVEHVPSDFDTFLVRMPSAQEISAVRTPRVQEVPQAPSTLSIPGSRTVAGPRLLHVWRDGLHTFVADKLPEESLVTQRDVFVLDLVSSLYVYCGEKADPIERELATLVADLRSFSRNGVEVLSSPDERFWSSLGGKSILDAEEFRDEQSSVRVWPVDFSREAGRPSQCLKPEIFHVWREGLDVYVTEVVVSSESLTTFDVFVLDAGDTLYVWGGEQCSQLEVELATFFAEHRKSVRNSDVEVSHTPDLKFWMLLGGECEIDDVRCVRNRSASTKLWGDTHMDPVPERDLVAERIVRNARMSSRKAERARAREQKRAAKVAREGSGPSLEHADVDGPQSRELPLPSKRELLMPAAANVTTDPLSRSEAKLLHVWREGSHTHVDELEAHHDSLTQKDAFVLDVGDALYVWCGDEVDPMEGHAAKFLAQLRQKERAGDATILHEMDDRFWSCLGGRGPIREGIRARAATAGSDAFSVAALPLDVPRGSAPVLLHVWRLDSETHVTEMPVERRSLTHADCFVLDAVHVIYVWCGSRCEVLERHAATFLANMRATQRDAQVMSEVDALFWSLLGGEGPIRGAPAVRKSIAQPIFSGPLAEGWLWKRGPTSHFKWQRRWCVLEAMKLTYYENSARSVKRGHVDLSSSTRAVSFESAKPPGDSIKYCHKRPFGFALDVKPEAGRMRHLEPGLLLYFDAGDAENMELWLAALRHVRH